MLDAPPATSRTRSSLVASPMKYRPPVNAAPLSTLQIVSPGPTPAVRKQPSSSASSTISNRGANTMYIFRQSTVGTVWLFLSVTAPSGRLMWYLVSLSPPANRMLRLAPNVTPCTSFDASYEASCASTGTVSCQDRTVTISPLPNLPITDAGGGLVLNAMVRALPEAVASITPD